MFHTVMELVFLAFPVTFLCMLVGAIAGGYFFASTGAIVGSLLGLVIGVLFEQRVQAAASRLARREWLGALFVTALVLIIGAIAILTR